MSTATGLNPQFFQHVGPRPSEPSTLQPLLITQQEQRNVALITPMSQEELELKIIEICHKLQETLKNRREGDKDLRFYERRNKLTHDKNAQETQHDQAAGIKNSGIAEGVFKFAAALCSWNDSGLWKVASGVFTAGGGLASSMGSYVSTERDANKTAYQTQAEEARAFYELLNRQIEEAQQSQQSIDGSLSQLLQIMQDKSRSTNLS